MFDFKHYVPVLKAKGGEFGALVQWVFERSIMPPQFQSVSEPRDTPIMPEELNSTSAVDESIEQDAVDKDTAS